MKWDYFGGGSALVGIGLTLILGLPPPWWHDMPPLLVDIGLAFGLSCIAAGLPIFLASFPLLRRRHVGPALLIAISVILFISGCVWLYVETESLPSPTQDRKRSYVQRIISPQPPFENWVVVETDDAGRPSSHPVYSGDKRGAQAFLKNYPKHAVMMLAKDIPSDKATASTPPVPTPMPSKPMVFPPSVLLVTEGNRLVLYNRDKTDLRLLGSKLGAEAPDMNLPDGKPRLLPVNGYYYFVTDILKAQTLALLGNEGHALTPFEVYISDMDHNEFTAHFVLNLRTSNGAFELDAQNIDVVEGIKGSAKPPQPLR